MDDEKIICPECGVEFATKEAHDIHHAEKHGGNISTATDLTDETENSPQ